MGLDNMRGSYGRCPPFLVGGLLVICVILTFNWWSLSSQNYDLIKQLEDLSEQLKISSEEHDLHVRQRLSFEGRIKNMEEEMAQLRVRLDQQRAENDEVKKQLGEREEELKTANKNKDEVQSTTVRCNTELESLKKLDISKDGAIASLRLEKDRLSTQLEEQKQEVSKLRAEVEQVHIEVSALKLAARPPKQDKQLLKVSTAVMPKRIGELSTVRPKAVYVNFPGLQGLLYHNEPILPKDPPDAVRPKPSLSVTYLTPAASAPQPRLLNAGISVGGNHEQSKMIDMDKVDNEENNAKERVDDGNGDTNADEPDLGQLEDVDRMEVGNEENEDPAKKDNTDTLARNIAQ